MTDFEYGLRIKEAREKAGMSQIELAKAIQVSEKTIRNYEKGGEMTLGVARKLSKVLSVDFYWLTGLECVIGNILPDTKTNPIQQKEAVSSREETIEELNKLLRYAPDDFIMNVLERLKKIKELSQL